MRIGVYNKMDEVGELRLPNEYKNIDWSKYEFYIKTWERPDKTKGILNIEMRLK